MEPPLGLQEQLIAIIEKARTEAADTIGSMNSGFAAWYADKLLEAGVAPVVHGYNSDGEWPSVFECSVCNWSCYDTLTGDTGVYNYCPNCGAKMDLKTERN